MQHIRDEIRIEAPAEHVWSYVTDSSHWDEIQPRAKHTDFSGPLDQVGTTFVQTSRMLGFETKYDLTVTEVEPLRLCHVKAEPGPWDMVWRLEPDGDATRLAIESDFEIPGPLPGALKNLMTKGWMEGSVRKMLLDIKAFTEATVPAHA